MLIAWRTQKTYPGFGRWTVAKVPNALGWLLISLHGLIPEWLLAVGNGLLLLSPILTYAGLRQFRGKAPYDVFNYALLTGLIIALVFFSWPQPNVNARLILLSAYAAVIFTRCAADLFLGAPRALRSSYWFTAAMFALYDGVLLVRVVTSGALPVLADPFRADLWQNILFLATNVVGIGWTFGFFMMTNNRLTLELQTAEVELREMATTDFLTGALNRRAFAEASRREHARARRSKQPLALVLMDLDRFKGFNDTHGHLAGDALLCAMVTTCRAHLRAADVLARWGGDEFAVLLPETDAASCRRVAERLRRSVAELSVPVGPLSAQATLSLGCALWGSDDETIDDVVSRADRALYEAKQRGRNCVVMETGDSHALAH